MSEEKPKVEIKYRDLSPATEKGTAFEDLSGLIPTVSTTPTGTARKISEQFRIMSGKLCFYDAENDAWTCLQLAQIYGGRVLASASAGTPFPTGWSVANTGTGFCAVTHNLGHTNYAVCVTVEDNPGRANIVSMSTTAFAVRTQNASGSDADFDFHFILTDES